MLIRPFRAADEPAVVALWGRCGLTRPWNDPQKDITRKLAVRPDLFLVAEIDDTVIGTVMVGYDGHRGWINYLGVDPDYRRKGVGRVLMAEAELLLRLEGCPKINLQVRTGNTEVIEFYRRVGFVMDDVISMGRRLEDDDPDRRM
jgi:ribosomal protein S18 acetylase RimI-like enzyme